MLSVSISEAEKEFNLLLRTAQHEAVEIRNGDGESAVLVSPECYRELREWRHQRFLRSWQELSDEAQANGLTEEKLAEILSDDSPSA